MQFTDFTKFHEKKSYAQSYDCAESQLASCTIVRSHARTPLSLTHLNHQLIHSDPKMEDDSGCVGSSGSSSGSFISHGDDDDDDDGSFLADVPELSMPMVDDCDSDSEDEDEDFFLNNDDDYSGFFSDSSMEHGTLLVPIFDIKAHEAERRDLRDLAYLSMLSDVRKERWQHERLV